MTSEASPPSDHQECRARPTAGNPFQSSSFTSTGPFAVLLNASVRDAFLSDISVLIEKYRRRWLRRVIDEAKLAAKHALPPNLYHLALQFGLERIQLRRGALQDESKLHVALRAEASLRIRSSS